MKSPNNTQMRLVAIACRQQARHIREAPPNLLTKTAEAFENVADFLDAVVRYEDAGDLRLAQARALLTFAREQYDEGVQDGLRRAELGETADDRE